MDLHHVGHHDSLSLPNSNPFPVLLVVIVPRIVPFEYISTTLGLHKSVRVLTFVYTPVLKLCVQLEHTGMTITQTLAGLWLDSGKNNEEKTTFATPLSKMGGPRLQWLLNWFLFVSALHLAAIWGLGYLNERKQNVQKDVAVQDEGEDGDEEQRDASGSTSGIDDCSVPQDPLSSHSSSDPTSPGGHTTSPLLHPRYASSIYLSYGTHPRPPRSQQDITLVGAATSAEVRRGKLFASMCAATVVFAWGLFLITSFIKIRSKRDREVHL